MKAINSNTSIDEAWAIAQSHKDAFDAHIKYYAIDAEWAVSPYWAYWFARHVIMDHWPVAESLIATDEYVQSAYRGYVSVLKNIRIIGYSIAEKVKVDYGVLNQRQIPLKIEDIEEHADRIAATVQSIKRGKKHTNKRNVQ